ncbi:hypothetical protein CW743_03530 [Staphylococcus shinii]|uniref:hypothetical protein n=2 Tax=Staphylococcus shinii TaxID=2912228 RepID=UPI000C321BE2|nr:hypothetical protein [Staphylococcus shinii]PKI15170.1 hypothetical protein CW743_03530 [Staphylococcus shinii]
MLSKRAEDFLLKLRIELLFRGKNEDEVNTIEEELRDHITIAEENNENIDALLNTPIKSYADKFSTHLNMTQGLFKYILYFISFMFIMTTIPRMLDNSFQLTIALICYFLFIFLGSFILILFFVKKLIMRWGDSKITYTIVGISSVAIFGIYILSEYLLRNYPLYIIWSPNQTTNFTLGLILLLLTMLTCFILKQKFYAGLILLLCIPNLIGTLFTGGDFTNKNYVIISSIIILIITWSFIIYTIIKYYRERESNDTNQS